MKINGRLADRISELEKENKELKQRLEPNPLETVVMLFCGLFGSFKKKVKIFCCET